MKKLAAILTLSAYVSSMACANDPVTAGILLDSCVRQEPVCAAFIGAYARGLDEGVFRQPDGSWIAIAFPEENNLNKIIDGYVGVMQAHPEEREHPASHVLYNMFKTLYGRPFDPGCNGTPGNMRI